MLIPILVLGFVAAIVALYRYLRTSRDPPALWRSALTIGLAIGVPRAVLACLGWYVVEHTGGPLQVPAYALALLAWPEVIALGRRRGPVPPQFYAALGAALIVGTLLLASAVALAVEVTHRRKSRTRGGAARADEP